ncbi:MAG TPA: carboxypeptidase-like regulatory domain-containing protein, partial [Prolixibacteraceae bacterium]|nr:carboxypeptidase-like regulatory domain-containing protein [Prolixibacteraceae bacterium]
MMMIRKNLKLFWMLAFLLLTIAGYAQQKTISGKVTDASNGEPLPGVTVVVVGTTVGTITNFDGDYSLKVDAGQTVSFSFIGFESQRVLIGNQNVINISLEMSTEALGEVLVIGYGTTKKEDATGSVQAVSTDDFNRGAITSPQELVSGKIAGVQITNGGGAPGEGATIRI